MYGNGEGKSLVGCTVFDNKGAQTDDPIGGATNLEIRNSILFGVQGSAARFGIPAYIALHDSCVQGLGADAGDVDCSTGAWPCADGEGHLRPDSPLRDTADSSQVDEGAVDLAGNPRLAGRVVDPGAYELRDQEKDARRASHQGYPRFEPAAPHSSEWSQ